MKNALLLLVIPACLLCTAFMPAERRCHSWQYQQARQQLDRMLLTKAQQDAIRTFDDEFHKKWSETHRTLGCSHHEDHANEFVAAAAGVLNSEQFQKFRGRQRNRSEEVGYDIWTNAQYIDNVLKLARSL